jgi:ABC-2 type transport system permease protein
MTRLLPSRRELAAATLVARTEFRRTLRRTAGETTQVVGIVLSMVLMLAVTVAVAGGAVVFGSRLSEVGELGRTVLRTTTVAGVLFGTAMVGFRVVGETGRVDGEAGMLTATSPLSVVLGLLLAELARVVAFVGFPLLIVAAALGVGTGSALVTVTTLVVVAVVAVLAVVAGYVLGQVVLYLSATVPVIRRNRLRLASVAMVAYFGVVVVFGDVVTVLAGTPLSWFVDPLLLAVGAGGDSLAAGVALLAPLVVVPAGVAVSVTLAEATWYGDTVQADDGSEVGRLVGGVGRVLAPVASRPTQAVARTVLVRARRAPYTLTFAFVPVFGAVGYAQQVIETGRVPPSAPVLAATYAGWAVGSAFTLNPFGQEGAHLPVTVSSGITGEQFVRGRVLAGWVPGLPLTLALVVTAGLVATALAPWRLLAATVYGMTFAAGAPLLSVGIGALVPKFDAQRVFANREAVIPSVWAFGLFAVLLVVLATPALLALSFPSGVGDLVGLTPVGAGVAGVAVTAVATGLLGALSYRIAVARFDGYTVG